MLNLGSSLKLDPDYVGGGTFALLAKKGAGKTYTARVMAEEMWDANVPFALLDPMGAGWGLRSSEDGNGEGIPVAIFGGEHGDLPLERGGGALMADLLVDDGLSMVLDMSQLGSRAAERQFALDFLERLYRRNSSLVHLFIDEADLFAPQKPQAGDQALLGVTENIVRRGRNKGIGITLITQRPAVLNKDVLTQVDGLVAMRMTGLTDRKAIDEWVKGHGDDEQASQVKESLSSLANGECWWWVPELGILKRVQIRRAHTFDSSPTRKRGEGRRDPKSFADVDMAAIGEKMADTIERAKRTDPRELTRRISELESQLASEPREPETITEIQFIDRNVPVFDASVVAGITGTIQDARADMADGLAKLNQIEEFVAEQVAEVKRIVADLPVAEKRGPCAPATARAPAPSVPERTRAGRGARSDMTGFRRKLLEVLSAYPDRELTTEQVGLLTGKSPKGGYFRNTLGSLRSEGLVEGLRITPEGIEAIGGPAAPPGRDEAIALWAGKLTGLGRDVFEIAVAIYPDGISDADIAERLDKSATAGYFRNSIGKVRGAGLIVKRGGLNYLNDAMIPPA